jgi:uncharacterized OB-fold protein
MSESHWIVKQKIEIPFHYTPGPALLRFLEGLRDGKIFASGVRGESRKTVPPLSFCGRSWKPADDWTELPGTGTLESFAVVPHGMAELPQEGERIVFGLVKLDGADTCLAHLFHTKEPGKLKVGAKVRVRWHAERSPGIQAIAGFDLL